jgi:hypothetical protein
MDRRALLLTAVAAAAFPAAARANEGGKKKDVSPYIALKAVTLTIVRTNGRHGAMTIELGLNIPDAGLRELATESQPLLRDAYVRALQPYALRLGPGVAPSAEFITLSLQRETDRVLGRRGAKVLLGGVLVI